MKDHRFKSVGFGADFGQVGAERAYAKLRTLRRPEEDPELFAQTRAAYYAKNATAHRDEDFVVPVEARSKIGEPLGELQQWVVRQALAVENKLIERRPDLALQLLQSAAWQEHTKLATAHHRLISKLALACVWMAPDLLEKIDDSFGTDWKPTEIAIDPVVRRLSLKRLWFTFLHEDPPPPALIDLIELAPVVTGERALALVTRYAENPKNQKPLPNTYLSQQGLARLGEYIRELLEYLELEVSQLEGYEPVVVEDREVEMDELDALWRRGWCHQEYLAWGAALGSLVPLVVTIFDWRHDSAGPFMSFMLLAIIMWIPPMIPQGLTHVGTHNEGWRAQALAWSLSHGLSLNGLRHRLEQHPRRRARLRAPLLNEPSLAIQEMLMRLSLLVNTAKPPRV